MSFFRWVRKHPGLFVSIWIAFCFSLTSGIWISWEYHLLDLTDGMTADLVSMGAGYLMQAGGAALFCLYLRRRPAPDMKKLFLYTLVCFGIVSLPALMSSYLAGAIAFGLLMNLLCGIIAGFYLYVPAFLDNLAQCRGIVFGGGYAVSTIAVFLLSLPGSGSFLKSRGVLPVYLAMAAASVWLAPFQSPGKKENEEPAQSSARPSRFGIRELLLLFAALFGLSLVKNLGFSFPSADFTTGISLELSRIFYAGGLIAAGVISDRSRRQGAICTVAALVLPFIMLALAEEPVPQMICWGLGYLFFGFFTVFRTIVFMDLASETNTLYLAPAGLMCGRAGDAAGTLLCMTLSGKNAMLVSVSAALFILTVFLFFRVYQLLYEPQAAAQKSEHEVFEAFSAQHDLSSREREVLRLVLSERSNGEIAEILFVSESTVKYHVHNLLKKTGCKSRLDLIRKYSASLYPQMESPALTLYRPQQKERQTS